jgi:predicted nucleotidyltransferase
MKGSGKQSALDSSSPLGRQVAEVTRRILQAVRPRQIYLFGSGARGRLGPDSDLDFLVIVRDPAHRRQVEQQIYRNLHGVGLPVDIIVATENDIAQYGDRVGTIYRPALQEGLVVYDAGD